MLDVQTLHPGALAPDDMLAWRALAAAQPGFDSPLLGPDFTQAVGALRPDARVCVFRRQGQAVGFLPYHRQSGGQARSIGGPFADYHGLVSAPALWTNGRQALADAGIAAWRFTALIDPFDRFPASAGPRGHLIVPTEGAEAYLERIRAASPKKIKNYRRLAGKLEREHGALRLVADDHSRRAFDQLLAWKRAQLLRTGMHDFLGPDWTRDLMDRLFDTPHGELRGLMMSLYAGETLVAGHFGVRLGGVFHPWIASTHPDFAPWSPGHQFFLKAIPAMASVGLTTYDLGPGHDHYKRTYALSSRAVTSGLATAPGVAGELAQGLEAAWRLVGADGPGLAGRLRRRLDAIVAVEPTLGGRLNGLAFAVLSHDRRRQEPVHDHAEPPLR